GQRGGQLEQAVQLSHFRERGVPERLIERLQLGVETALLGVQPEQDGIRMSSGDPGCCHRGQ
ncbi:MAG: hypothetical protein ACRYHQ_23945, partial [Janthinobacterium lividum]